MDEHVVKTTFFYTPYFIRDVAQKRFGETVTHEDWNDAYNLNRQQGDYNTEVLRLLFTNVDPSSAPHIPYIDGYLNEAFTDIDNINDHLDTVDEQITDIQEHLLDVDTHLGTIDDSIIAINDSIETLFDERDRLRDDVTTLFNGQLSLQHDIDSLENSVLDNTGNIETLQRLVTENAEDIIELETGKQKKLIAGANITIYDDGTIEAVAGAGYRAGDNIVIENNTISTPSYTAGENININNYEISANVQHVYTGTVVPEQSLGNIGDVYIMVGGL